MAIKIGKTLGKVGKFVKNRLKEKSTYIGAAAIAVALGKPEIAEAIGKYADIGFLILGGALVGADTTNTTHLETE
jgi:hypothetical protein